MTIDYIWDSGFKQGDLLQAIPGVYSTGCAGSRPLPQQYTDEKLVRLKVDGSFKFKAGHKKFNSKDPSVNIQSAVTEDFEY